VTRTPGTETAIVPATLPADAPVVLPAAALPAAAPAPDAADPDGVPVPLPAPPRQGQSRLPYSFERSLQAVPHGLPAITHERISFTAPCPACGTDAEWVEVREDTRVRCAVHCPCV
jgi:hypothetical protein